MLDKILILHSKAITTSTTHSGKTTAINKLLSELNNKKHLVIIFDKQDNICLTKINHARSFIILNPLEIVNENFKVL